MTAGEIEPMGSGGNVTAEDEIATYLRRYLGDEISKERLQEMTGLETEELRAGLASLEEQGVIRTGDEGYTWVDPADRLRGDGFIGQGSAPEASPARAEEPQGRVGTAELASDEPDEPAAAEPVADIPRATPGSDTSYRAAILIQVEFHPELAEGEDPDAGAFRESRDLATAAVDGILTPFPDLGVSANVLKLEAFDKPRQVFPPADGD